MCKFEWVPIFTLLLLHQSCLAQDNDLNSFFSPGNGNNQDNAIGQRQNQNQPPSVPSIPNVPVDDTTTTTASPAFRSCVENCRTIQNYNPVCGSDGVTYNNQFRLQCARRCGLNVQMVRGGSCVSL